MKHWLQTKCEQGDSKAALVSVLLQAAHNAFGFDSVPKTAGGSVALVLTGEIGVSGRKIGGRVGVVVSSATLGLAASEKTGDSPGVGRANIFLGRAGVCKGFRSRIGLRRFRHTKGCEAFWFCEFFTRR